eukprot:3476815-Amphidinium_carterae.2
MRTGWDSTRADLWERRLLEGKCLAPLRRLSAVCTILAHARLLHSIEGFADRETIADCLLLRALQVEADFGHGSGEGAMLAVQKGGRRQSKSLTGSASSEKAKGCSRAIWEVHSLLRCAPKKGQTWVLPQVPLRWSGE